MESGLIGSVRERLKAARSLVVLTGAVWFYFKAPGYSRPGSSCSSCSPGSSCSKQPQQQPAKPEEEADRPLMLSQAQDFATQLDDSLR